MKFLKQLTKENILKFLILIGIAAISFSAYIQYVTPYLHELSQQKKDEVRIKDLDNLDNLLKSAATSAFALSKNKIIYISIPSDDATCSDLELPSVPDDWAYNCASTSTLRNTDGTGWIPIDFSNQISVLPIDPINNENTLNYYAYVASTTQKVSGPEINRNENVKSEYVLTATLDSEKYLKEKDRNVLAHNSRHSVGNNIKIWSSAIGLIGYWPVDEGEGLTIKDKSGNDNAAEIIGVHNWSMDERNFKFNGENYVNFSSSDELNKLGGETSSYSIGFSIRNLNKDQGNIPQSISEKWNDSSTYPWAIRIEDKKIVFAIYDGKNWTGASADNASLYNAKWNDVFCVKDAKTNSLRIYLNGYIINTTKIRTSYDTSNKDGFTLGSRNNKGDFKIKAEIKNFSIYNKSLKSLDFIEILR